MNKQNNRFFIGIEKVADYFEIARNRIENAINTPEQSKIPNAT